MKMTPDGARKWQLDPTTPTSIIEHTLRDRAVMDWPLPRYLLDELHELAQIENPTQADVDKVKIPLINHFRQARERLTGVEPDWA
jgi:hypothetical protein